MSIKIKLVGSNKKWRKPNKKQIKWKILQKEIKYSCKKNKDNRVLKCFNFNMTCKTKLWT